MIDQPSARRAWSLGPPGGRMDALVGCVRGGAWVVIRREDVQDVERALEDAGAYVIHRRKSPAGIMYLELAADWFGSEVART